MKACSLYLLYVDLSRALMYIFIWEIVDLYSKYFVVVSMFEISSRHIAFEYTCRNNYTLDYSHI